MWKYAANYWLRNMGVLPAGIPSEAILFVKYEKDQQETYIFTLVLLTNRFGRPYCCMLSTSDFLKIDFKVLDISNLSYYPVTVEEFQYLPVTKSNLLTLDPNPKTFEEQIDDYERIAGIIDLHPQLHKSWKLMFTTLVTTDVVVTNANGLQIVRISANEVFLRGSDENRMRNPATKFINEFDERYRSRNLRKMRRRWKTKNIGSYWDKKAYHSNLARHQQEDLEEFQHMGLSENRAELATMLLQFLTV